MFQLLEERFLRHVAESEQRTSKEIADLRQEVAGVQAGLGKEIGEVRQEVAGLRADLGKEIAGVHKEITVQTRWIVAVMAAAAVLIPVLQRVMEAIIP